MTTAERVRDRSLLARVHRTLLFIHTFIGPPDAARHHGERAVELAEASGEKTIAWSAHWGLATLGGFTGQAAAVEHHLAEAQRIADELHSPVLREIGRAHV